MTSGERVRELRKALELTMEVFGNRLGVKKSAISGIESDKRNLTEQMAKAICREFHVNYGWLTEGVGEMFLDSDDDVIEMIDRVMAGENEFHKNLFKTLASLSAEELLVLEKVFNRFCENYGEIKKG